MPSALVLRPLATLRPRNKIAPAIEPDSRRTQWQETSTSSLLADAGVLPRQQTATQVYRYGIIVPDNHHLEALALSPAGDQIIYQAVNQGNRRLYRRNLDEQQSRPIAGTEEGRSPFFSPDGQRFGFFTPGRLKIAGPSGIRTLATLTPSLDQFRAVWGQDTYIYFNSKVGIHLESGEFGFRVVRRNECWILSKARIDRHTPSRTER